MKTPIIIASLILLTLNAFAQNPSGKENIPTSSKEFEMEMVKLINDFRKKNNLNELVWNESLARAARYHASDMQKDDYFEHESHDRVGGRLKKTLKTFDRVRLFADKNLFINSENIGAGQNSAKEMFEDWKNSAGHRKNMLNPTSIYIAVGYVFIEKDEYQHYWVMDTAEKKL